MKAASLLVAGALILLLGVAIGVYMRDAPSMPVTTVRPQTTQRIVLPTPTRQAVYRDNPDKPKVMLACADCDAEGIPIYVYSEPQNGRILCELRKLTYRKATLLGELTLPNGRVMAKVATSRCLGWVAASMID